MKKANEVHAISIGEKGTPLIMLHGWGHSLDSLKQLGTLLSNNSQVHLIDLPGFGQTPTPSEVWDSFDYADVIHDYAQKHNLDNFDLLGHSFGGKVAFSYAAKYPEKVRKLILVNSSGLKRKRSFYVSSKFLAIRWLGKIIKIVDKCIGTSIFKNFFTLKFGSPDYRNANPQMRSILVRSVNEDLSATLLKISTPTLLLWGEDDQETPVEIAKRFHNYIFKSKLHILPNKDHLPFQDVGSHLCAHYIQSFLKEKQNG